MKFLFVLLVILAANIFAAERVNMKCKFDAIADGYVSKTYTVNLILNDGGIYNSDGSTGPFQRKAVYGTIGSFNLYDGFGFQRLDWNLDERNTRKPKQNAWSLSVGTVTCAINRGWVNEVYNNATQSTWDPEAGEDWGELVPQTATSTWDPEAGEDWGELVPQTATSTWDPEADLAYANNKKLHDTVYVPYRTTTVVHDTVYDRSLSQIVHNVVVIHDTVTFVDTTVKVVHDTVLMHACDTCFDTTQLTKRLTLRGHFSDITAKSMTYDFAVHFLMYKDTLLDENGQVTDSAEVALYFTSGTLHKTVKIEINTLSKLIGHPSVYPTKTGNFFLNTEPGWGATPAFDWKSAAVPRKLSLEIQALQKSLGR